MIKEGLYLPYRCRSRVQDTDEALLKNELIYQLLSASKHFQL